MAEGLNIGITFHWEITWKDIWKNKVAQNVYFLSKVLEKQPNVESVYLFIVTKIRCRRVMQNG